MKIKLITISKKPVFYALYNVKNLVQQEHSYPEAMLLLW